MLRISQLKLPENHTIEDIRKKLLKVLSLRPEELLEFSIRKRSIDARRKPQIYYVYTVDFSVRQEDRVLHCGRGRLQRLQEAEYKIPQTGTTALTTCPTIIGSGPAGLFSAYLLSQAGYSPVILERGPALEERKRDVEHFWKTGILDPNSNVQFGEGGAGTFSDGKLNTLVRDRLGRNRYVLETFVKFGAPREILYEQKPHVGTDVLEDVIRNMRKAIIHAGGKFFFRHQLTDIDPENSRIEINGTHWRQTHVLILALGHSARDTFQMLYDRNLHIGAKSFAVGIRIEHPQALIDQSQYGRRDRRGLPAATYKLAEKLKNTRGVYSFCMCPGGYVVNASSEEGYLAVNGMSYHGRAGENANSAIVVTVSPRDFGSTHPLGGIAFQRKLEEAAWQAGKGKVPVQRFGDFQKGRESTAIGSVKPNIKGAYQLTNVRRIFPEEIADSLEEGILKMGDKIQGFADPDVLISGVESRTSSPLRIDRNGELQSNVPWIYPCGEGAGYAGGIMSAAMDGMRVAEAIIRKYAPPVLNTSQKIKNANLYRIF